MKRVLILGAGMVTRSIVHYLLDRGGIQVTLADCIEEKVRNMLEGHPNGKCCSVDVNDINGLKPLISESDLVVSLVPYNFNPAIAELCIAAGIDMVTASYLSDSMKQLDSKAMEAGVLILNEIGLDPGIDHMSAARIIHGIQKNKGLITSFYSYCGGLPSPESNNNPFGYKFSWSPRGVVLAGKNSALYLKNKNPVTVESKDLFSHTWDLNIKGVGTLIAYPNRNSMPYLDLYGLVGIDTLYRGTLRYPGWCETWKCMVDLGLLDQREREDLVSMTYEDLIRELTGSGSEDSLRSSLASFLNIDMDSDILDRFEWLGLLSRDYLTEGKNTILDVLCGLLYEKLKYGEGEKDMVVLHHVFTAEYPDEDYKEQITSTLIDYGMTDGDSAMARTVSLPAAIAVRLILEDKIDLSGVHIPVLPSIYGQVLDELETLGIVFQETCSKN